MGRMTQATPHNPAQNPFHMVTIPGTDLEITPLNLGGNTFGWTSTEEESFDVLDAFVAGGGNFIDTADVYSQWAEGHSGGESETVLGSWLATRGNREDIVLATKVGSLGSAPGLTRDVVLRNLDDSLERLQTDVIDLYYYHFDDESVDIIDQVDTAAALVDSGRVRYIGLSNYRPERMREFFETAQFRDRRAIPVAIQPDYSLLARSGYENDFQGIAEEYGVAVFSYFSLASGLLTGKYRSADDISGAAREAMVRRYLEKGSDPFGVVDILVEIADRHSAEPTSVALAWVLAKGVTAPIASASRASQIPALLAATRLQLSDDEVTALDVASAQF